MNKFILSVLFILCISFAAAVPQLPTGYYGFVKDSSNNPVQEVLVTVKDIQGIIVGRSPLTNSEGFYNLNVLWDSQDTEAKEGVSPGSRVKFYVEGSMVYSEIVKEQGSNNQVDLRYSTGSSSSSNIAIPGEQNITGEENETIAVLTDTKNISTKTEEPVNGNKDIEVKIASEEQKTQDNVKSEDKRTGIPAYTFILIALIVFIIIIFIFKLMRK